MLIGVTSFFRDKEAFLSLQKNVIPNLDYTRPQIRIWSCACSTGEEVYSTAILLAEYIEQNRLTENQSFATNYNRKIRMDHLVEKAVSELLPPAVLLDAGDNILQVISNINHFLDLKPGKRVLYNRSEYYLVSLQSLMAGHGEGAMEFMDSESLAGQRIEDLERELQASKESLHATLEELETSNKELQSTNEELIASNEEVQSTNEELQSVNEELHTVNAEYRMKSYNGTSMIYHTKAKLLFSYTYDLLEHTKDIESVLLFLINMVVYHWNEEAEEFEGDIVTYCPSQEEWKQLFQWEEEGDYRYQTAKQIEQQGEQLK